MSVCPYSYKCGGGGVLRSCLCLLLILANLFLLKFTLKFSLNKQIPVTLLLETWETAAFRATLHIAK